MRPTRNKFHARRTPCDGYWFDSQAEARRYGELKLLEKAGEIAQLEVHPRLYLWAFAAELKVQLVGSYVADFTYQRTTTDPTVSVWEDVKSCPTRTALYRLKKRIVKANYGIDITEVE